jgi:hypothetical protein
MKNLIIIFFPEIPNFYDMIKKQSKSLTSRDEFMKTLFNDGYLYFYQDTNVTIKQI